MKKAIIFGANDLSQLLNYHIKDTTDIQVCAFVVDSGYKKEESYCGLPLVEYKDALKLFAKDEYGVYVCLGYSNMNKHRQIITERLAADGYSILSYIHPTSKVANVQLGRGTIVFQNTILDAYAKIGDGNILNINSNLAHHSTIGSYNYISSYVCISGHVVVGNHCFIGVNSALCDGINISDFTLVGAGACVTKDTLPYDVIAPERSIVLAGKRSTDFF